MKTIAITIEEEALERVDRIAGKGRRKRINRSAVIRKAIQDYMNRLEQQAREERENEIVRKHYRKLNRQGAALVRAQAKL